MHNDTDKITFELWNKHVTPHWIHTTKTFCYRHNKTQTHNHGCSCWAMSHWCFYLSQQYLSINVNHLQPSILIDVFQRNIVSFKSLHSNLLQLIYAAKKKITLRYIAIKAKITTRNKQKKTKPYNILFYIISRSYLHNCS